MDRLWVRLTLGFLAVTLATLAVAAMVVNASVQASFQRYVGQSDFALLSGTWEDSLVEHYAALGTWAGAEALLPGAGRNQAPGHGGGDGRGAQSLVADADGVVQIATVPEWIGQPMDAIRATRRIPLRLNGNIVGWLGQQTPGLQLLDQAESEFVTQVRSGLVLTGLVSSLLALLLGGTLAYSLARPLGELARHIAGIGPSRVGEPAPVTGPREVRELAGEFNALSARLATADAQRQRMAADVAHELRTPVTVLRGHLEAMMDGVYPLDAEHVAVAYDETLHLTRLVSDLQLLTRAEAGRLALDLAAVAPGDLVAAAAGRFAPLAQDAGIALDRRVEPGLPAVSVDIGRMQQVLDNLLVNALRHTEPGGEILLAASRATSGVAISVANTGEIPPEQLAHVFDRFWRADEARARDTGGSGLGLAISRELVRLHGGTIAAACGEGQTRFVVRLPAV